MSTVAIQIGNSDNRLTQERWSEFFKTVHLAIRTSATQIHFSGLSEPSSPYQNAAWIFEIGEAESQYLYQIMKSFCEMFEQESIAWTEGKTIFCGKDPIIRKDEGYLSNEHNQPGHIYNHTKPKHNYPESNVT